MSILCAWAVFCVPVPTPQSQYFARVAGSGPFDASGTGSHSGHPVMIEPTSNLLLGMLEKANARNPMESAKIDLFH